MTTTSVPRISIVTPSYNQGQYLEAAIRSVQMQAYPNLEHVVIDGGSTDNSTAILRAWDAQLTDWVSERDAGQYAAINKGFARTSGDIMAWLNSDDMYCHWAFKLVARIFTECPDVNWLTTSTPLFYNEDDTPKHLDRYDGFTAKRFYWGHTLGDHPHHCGWIQQESTFWRRSLWETAGGQLDTAYTLAADFDLWARFYAHTPLYSVAMPLGGLRMHATQRSVQAPAMYYAQSHAILSRYTPPEEPKPHLLRRLRQKRQPALLRRLARRFADKQHTVYYDWSADKWRTGWSYLV